jgi:hypothetical protein
MMRSGSWRVARTRKTRLRRREPRRRLLGKELENAQSKYVGRRYGVVLSAQERQVPPTLASTRYQADQRKISEVDGMKFATACAYADPEAAARKLIEIANSVEAVQDGRIHIEGTPAEYSAGLALAIERGWLTMHESGTYVKFTRAHGIWAIARIACDRAPRGTFLCQEG